MSGPERWGVDIRWARGEQGWLELRDPTDGQIHHVWARDCPPLWRRYATVRAKLEREARDGPRQEPGYAF